MSKFFGELLVIFIWILRASLIASMLVVCAVLLRKIFKDKLAVQFKYILWVIVFIRLIVPVFPGSKLSIFNYIHYASEKPAAIYLDNESYYKVKNNNKHAIFNKIFTDSSKEAVIIEDSKEVNKNLILKYSFRLWLLGMIILAVVHIAVRIIFNIKLILDRKYVEDERTLILEKCKKRARYYKNIELFESNAVESPCVFGILSPKILIPYNLKEKLSDKDLGNVFIHEISHIKRKDILRIYLTQIILAVHWFNPFIWYAYKLFREDTELCCDNKVLNKLDNNEVKNYGMTIIKLMSNFSGAHRRTAAVGAVGSKDENKKRIKMISKYKRITAKNAALGVMIVIIFVMTTLTDSKAFAIQQLKIADNINVPFEADEEVLGNWDSIDFVPSIESFQRNKSYWNKDIVKLSIQFNEDGSTQMSWFTWTKGLILHHGEKTASKYYIKEIDGNKYLFMEWKSGDYTYRGEITGYYVFKKVN